MNLTPELARVLMQQRVRDAASADMWARQELRYAGRRGRRAGAPRWGRR